MGEDDEEGCDAAEALLCQYTDIDMCIGGGWKYINPFDALPGIPFGIGVTGLPGQWGEVFHQMGI